jgi:hypothetical protein
MTKEQLIESIKLVKNTIIKQQLYELAAITRDAERLSYTIEDEFQRNLLASVVGGIIQIAEEQSKQDETMRELTEKIKIIESKFK